MKLAGNLIEIGDLDGVINEPGFVMRLGSSRLITVVGFTQAELKRLSQFFGSKITVTIESSEQHSDGQLK